MVKVYFDLYGPDFSSLINHDIRHEHVTYVGFVYAFYKAQVAQPQLDNAGHNSTKRTIFCKACEWKIVFKRPSSGRSKHSTIRDKNGYGPWHLSELPPPHIGCTCSQTIFVRKSEHLVHYRPFVDAILANPQIKMAEASSLWTLPFKLSSTYCQDSTFCRAKQAIKQSLIQDLIASYNNLGAFLLQLKDENKNLTIALQLDHQNRFYRVFVGFPQSANFHGQVSYSFMQTDGFHFKGSSYDGIAIVYCTKTGFSRNMILAFAIVPRESTEHHSWSLQMLWRCNPNMTASQVLFTDRGHLLNAVRCIHDQLGITIPINYCDRHFIRNIVSQFKIKKQLRHIISTGIRQCAASQTIDQFLSSIEDFATCLLSSQDLSSNALLTARIMLYILKVHPRFWTVFANRTNFDIISWEFQLNKLLNTFATVVVLGSSPLSLLEGYFQGTESFVKQVEAKVTDLIEKHMRDMSTGPPIPPALPRFNTYTTNLVEGEALRAINNSTRFSDVTNAIQCFCLAINKGIEYTKEACTRILHKNSKAKYTAVGFKVAWWYQKSSPEVISVHPTSSPLEVIGHVKFDNGRPHNVRLSFKKSASKFRTLCDNCSLSEMMDAPCACCHLVFKEAMEKKIFPEFDNNDWHRLLYHPAHLMEYTQACIRHMQPVIIPTHDRCLSTLNRNSFLGVQYDGSTTRWNGIVLPPPKYRLVDTASQKRIRSSGEGGKSTARSPTRNREGVRLTKETSITSAPRITKKFATVIALFKDWQSSFQESSETDDTSRHSHSEEDVSRKKKDVRKRLMRLRKKANEDSDECRSDSHSEEDVSRKKKDVRKRLMRSRKKANEDSDQSSRSDCHSEKDVLKNKKDVPKRLRRSRRRQAQDPDAMDGTVVGIRNPPTCSNCGIAGHRFDACILLNSAGAGHERAADLQPGIYAVYNTPGIDNEYHCHPMNASVDLSIPPRELEYSTGRAPTFNFVQPEELLSGTPVSMANDNACTGEDISEEVRYVNVSNFGLDGHSRLRGKIMRALTELATSEVVPISGEGTYGGTQHTNAQRKRPSKRTKISLNGTALTKMIEMSLCQSNSALDCQNVGEALPEGRSLNDQLTSQVIRIEPPTTVASQLTSQSQPTIFEEAFPMANEEDQGASSTNEPLTIPSPLTTHSQPTTFEEAFPSPIKHEPVCTNITMKSILFDSSDDEALMLPTSIFGKSDTAKTGLTMGFQRGDAKTPYLIADIKWGISSGTRVSQTCALDSVLFAWYTLHKNGWIVPYTSELKRKVFQLMDSAFHSLDADKNNDGNKYDDARHEVYRSGASAWGNEDQFQKYMRGMSSNGYGTATRYIDFCPSSHIGINHHCCCETCGRTGNRHQHIDMLAIDTLPDTANELNEEIKQLLSGDTYEECDLMEISNEVIEMISMYPDDNAVCKDSNPEEFDDIIAREKSIEEHIAHQAGVLMGKCSGNMRVKRMITHMGRFLILKQASIREHGWKTRPRSTKRKRKSAKPTSKLLFTNLSLSDLKIFGVACVVKYVLFCDGGHFRVAVSTRDGNWIAHDGLLGWWIGKHGDTKFGQSVQCDQFEIAQIVYELEEIPGEQSCVTHMAEHIIECKQTISAIARRCTLEMSKQIWIELGSTNNREEYHEEDILQKALETVINQLDPPKIKNILEQYSNQVLSNMTGVRKQVVTKLLEAVDKQAEQCTETGAVIAEQQAMKTKESLIKAKEDFKFAMHDMGYAILVLPVEMTREVEETLHQQLPNKSEFQPIFTCRLGWKGVDMEIQKSWSVNEDDGITCSDGKRLEARLGGFSKSHIKANIERWLEQQTGKQAYVMGDCKIIKSLRGCARQEMHTDFNVDDKEDLNFMFGILPIGKPVNLWVVPRNSNGDKREERLQPGQIFLGRGSLIHGGGTTPGLRLHFMYVPAEDEMKYTDYNETTFVDYDECS